MKATHVGTRVRAERGAGGERDALTQGELRAGAVGERRGGDCARRALGGHLAGAAVPAMPATAALPVPLPAGAPHCMPLQVAAGMPGHDFLRLLAVFPHIAGAKLLYLALKSPQMSPQMIGDVELVYTVILLSRTMAEPLCCC